MRRAFSSKSLRINFSLFRHSLKVRTSVFFLRRVRGHGIKEVVLFIFCDAEIVCRLFSCFVKFRKHAFEIKSFSRNNRALRQVLVRYVTKSTATSATRTSWLRDSSPSTSTTWRGCWSIWWRWLWFRCWQTSLRGSSETRRFHVCRFRRFHDSCRRRR